MQVYNVYTNFSRAFDSVNQSLFTAKVTSFGTNGSWLRWFRSHLKGRVQYVKFKKFVSDTIDVLTGIPQGS